jgi:diguanylate cyclase (GGDEF)-like protein
MSDSAATPIASTAPLTAPGLGADALARWLGTMGAALLAGRAEGLLVHEAASGRIVHADAPMAAWLGRPKVELPGLLWSDLLEPAAAAVLRAADQAALATASPAPVRSEHRLDTAAGRREFSVLRLASEPQGGRRWLVSTWCDRSAEMQRELQLKQALEQIEQQQRAHEALRRELADQALRDAASGLHTRAHFEDQLRREVDLSTREHREFALVFAELDAATPAVQALGAAGQHSVLAAMGRLLRGGTRAMDASCRFDERRFAVLLSGVGLATAHSRMEGLRRRCATEIVVHEGRELGFSVSMGVASFPHTAHTQASLVDACEAALAEAKRRGGNHVTLAAIRFEAS